MSVISEEGLGLRSISVGCQDASVSVWYILASASTGGPFALTMLRACDYTVKRMYN